MILFTVVLARGIRVTYHDKFKSKELKLYVIRSLLFNILTSWILTKLKF